MIRRWGAILAGSILLLLTMGARREAAPSVDQLRQDHYAYLHEYVQADGRVVDRSLGNGITTSEGQAYALLRTLWTQDPSTFEAVRLWTLHNLQLGDPARLPAWKWGHRDDGSWGTYDTNPASDADLLIAWALLHAGRAWHRPAYTEQARQLMSVIWESETREIAGRRVLMPGPWAMQLDPVPINPSYFLPFVFRDFALVDREHDWMELVDTSYALWGGMVRKHRLPPDWFWIDPNTAELVKPPPGDEHKKVFGWEAMRIPWTLAFDIIWHGERRAEGIGKRFDVLGSQFARTGQLPAVLSPRGKGRAAYESRALYGSLLPLWAKLRPEHLPGVLSRLHALKTESRPPPGMDYYAQNWVWFGQALWSGLARPMESQ